MITAKIRPGLEVLDLCWEYVCGSFQHYVILPILRRVVIGGGFFGEIKMNVLNYTRKISGNIGTINLLSDFVTTFYDLVYEIDFFSQ